MLFNRQVGGKIMTRIVGRWMAVAIVGCLITGSTVRSRFSDAGSVTESRKLDQASASGMRGDYASAISLSTEVIEHQPTNAVAYTMRGTAHRRSGEYSEAIADLNRAIELNPRFSEAYTQRAFTRQQSRAPNASQQIMADLNQAVVLNPKSALAHLARGNQYAVLNDHEAAIADFNQALRLNPRSYSAAANRASSQLSLGRLDEARQDLQRALQLNPPDGDRKQIDALLQSVISRNK